MAIIKAVISKQFLNIGKNNKKNSLQNTLERISKLENLDKPCDFNEIIDL